jgi:hypothetical protein
VLHLSAFICVHQWPKTLSVWEWAANFECPSCLTDKQEILSWEFR